MQIWFTKFGWATQLMVFSMLDTARCFLLKHPLQGEQRLTTVFSTEAAAQPSLFLKESC